MGWDFSGNLDSMAWEELKELDSENERVISMYDGIKRILEKQRQDDAQTQKPAQKTVERKAKGKKATPAPPEDEGKNTLPCGRILKVNVEPRLVVVTIEKYNGELRELRIEAMKD
jgi:hypothetical protein